MKAKPINTAGKDAGVLIECTEVEAAMLAEGLLGSCGVLPFDDSVELTRLQRAPALTKTQRIKIMNLRATYRKHPVVNALLAIIYTKPSLVPVQAEAVVTEAVPAKTETSLSP